MSQVENFPCDESHYWTETLDSNGLMLYEYIVSATSEVVATIRLELYGTYGEYDYRYFYEGRKFVDKDKLVQIIVDEKGLYK